MRHVIVLAVIFSTALLAAGKERPTSSIAGEAGAAATASNRFGLDLYQVLRTKPGNLFFSPYSVSVALAMTREGARGSTAKQMDDVLHFGSAAAANGHLPLARALRPVPTVDGYGRDAKQRPSHEIHVANAIWGQEGLAFEKPFLKRLEAAYGAGLERIDFEQTEAARQRINGWVAKETMDRIKDIIPPGLPSADTLIALANAIHFKAAWKKPFEERATRPAPFTTADGEISVPMMRVVDSVGYAGTEDAHVVELDYLGGTMSMVLVVPKAKNGLAALEAKLDAAELTRLIGSLQPTRVRVGLPKFSFTCSRDLTSTLPTMGMTDAFRAGKADFTGMTTEEPLFIGLVLHKAFVAVDEAGTEAAAATVVMMLRGGAPSGDPLEVTADRPFLFLIRHKTTGCILFMGRVENPTAN